MVDFNEVTRLNLWALAANVATRESKSGKKLVTVTASDGRQALMPKATAKRLDQEQLDRVVERLFRGKYLDRKVCKELGVVHVDAS